MFSIFDTQVVFYFKELVGGYCYVRAVPHPRGKILFIDTVFSSITRFPAKIFCFQLVQYPSNYPIADWAILSIADAFIGNCVSTFTSFVVRQREVHGLPNYFWAFEHGHPKVIHEEL